MISFYVPAMPVATRTSVGAKKGRTKIKKDSQGNKVWDYRVIPKERPRSTTKGRTYTPSNTINFEKHIRKYFFEKYPSEFGVVREVGGKSEVVPVHSYFMGCKLFGSSQHCDLYRKDSSSCTKCKSRRKNLSIEVIAYLKNNRHIDGDNILKVVLDALEGVCFFNDSHFFSKTVKILPYAEAEGLFITLNAHGVEFISGSLVGAYSVEYLGVESAREYVLDLLNSFSMGDRDMILQHLKRRDKRKYLLEFERF